MITDTLFPTFSNPTTVTLLVCARFALHCCFVGLVGGAFGRRAPPTVAAATLAVVSAVLPPAILRPGGLWAGAAFLDFLAQLVLPALAGYAVYSESSVRRWIGFGVLLAGAFFFLSTTIPLYGQG
jgi:hypothetical protein